MLLLILGTLCFLVTGPYRAWHWSYDFVSVYCGSRCLLYGCNPYDMAAVEQQYTLSGGTDPHFHSQAWRHSQPPVYPPSTFVAMIPFALLELPAAQDLWIVINTLLLVAAVFYFISSVSDSYRWLANLFGAFFLGISPGTLHWGNPALLAISLLILSCSLYRRERMPVLAAGLLCVSLALKPQIGGLVALFLLAEKAHRRSAAAAIATAVALLLIGAATLQSRPQSEHWLTDMRTNAVDSFLPGHVNDPASPFGFEVNIESAVVVVSPGPMITKIVTYGFLVILAASLGYCIAKFRPSFGLNGLLLGSIVVFSIIAVYHRRFDMPLLFLTLPSLIGIFAWRQIVGVTALALTLLAGFPVESLINPWLMTHHPAILQSILDHKVLFLLLLRQQNLALIVLFCLYLAAIYSTGIRHPKSSDNHELFIGRVRRGHPAMELSDSYFVARRIS